MRTFILIAALLATPVAAQVPPSDPVSPAVVEAHRLAVRAGLKLMGRAGICADHVAAGTRERLIEYVSPLINRELAIEIGGGPPTRSQST